MTLGIFYGIGVGPGDPELMTVKGAGILTRCRHVFAPKARIAADSLALDIAKRYISAGTTVHELVFPMTPNRKELSLQWRKSAVQVA